MAGARVSGIDALRGVAATSIIFLHVVFYNTSFPIPRLAYDVASQSSLAVELFFLISAFSLYLSYFDEMRRPGGLRRYAIKRFFRIVPLYWFMILVWICIHLWQRRAIPVESVAAEATFTHGIFPVPGFVHAGWTIGIEALFYVVLPFLIVAVRSITSAMFAFLVSCALAIVFAGPHFHTNFVGQLPTFMAGVVAFFAYRVVPKRFGTLVVAAVVVYFTALYFAFPSHNINDPVWHSFAVFGLAWLVLGVALKAPYVFDNAATNALGRWSYSIYLLHPAVIVFARGTVEPWLFAMPWPSPWWPLMMYFGFVVAVTICLAAMTVRLVERPGGDIGRWVLRKRQTAPRPQPASAV